MNTENLTEQVEALKAFLKEHGPIEYVKDQRLRVEGSGPVTIISDEVFVKWVSNGTSNWYTQPAHSYDRAIAIACQWLEKEIMKGVEDYRYTWSHEFGHQVSWEVGGEKDHTLICNSRLQALIAAYNELIGAKK